jgi:polyhydroxyalkanoate synthesis regulator phasin
MVSKTKNAAAAPHELWLAGLGAVSLARKQAIKAYDVLVKEGSQFRTAATKRIDALRQEAGNRVGEVKARVEARVEPVMSRANDVYGTARNELGQRLAPVVNLFGKATARKATPVARKRPAAKKAVKKAVRKTATKSGAKKAA